MSTRDMTHMAAAIVRLANAIDAHAEALIQLAEAIIDDPNDERAHARDEED